VNLLPPPLRSQAGLRGVGRGPAGGRASDAAIVALHVRGGLIVAAVSLCLRISVQWLLEGVGVHTSTQFLRNFTSTLARHIWRNTENCSTRVRYRRLKLFCP
jgi:hypothetical protein